MRGLFCKGLGAVGISRSMEVRMWKVAAIIVVLCSISAFGLIRRPLNSFIRHHETLDYSLRDFHSRIRRSVVSSPFTISDLKFKAFGKQIHIRLRRDHTIFSSDYSILDGHGKPIDISTANFVEGDIKGHFGSYVHGAVKNGRFQGRYNFLGLLYCICCMLLSKARTVA